MLSLGQQLGVVLEMKTKKDSEMKDFEMENKSWMKMKKSPT